VEIFDNKIGIENTPGPTDAYASADPKRRCPDLTKIKTKLNYSSKVDLKTGIKRFVEWAKSINKELLSQSQNE